jgi:hypothetical protein
VSIENKNIFLRALWLFFGLIKIIAPNRGEMMKYDILDVLAEALLVPGELQIVALGALKNLTLDGIVFIIIFIFLHLSFSIRSTSSRSHLSIDTHLHKFSQAKAIDNLMRLLNTLPVGKRATFILSCIRNLSFKGLFVRLPVLIFRRQPSTDCG